MGLLSSCKEAPLIAVCDLCEDGDPKSRRTVQASGLQAALPQVLAAASQHFPAVYTDGRSPRPPDEEVFEEPPPDPQRAGAGEDGEAFRRLSRSFRDALRWPLRGAATGPFLLGGSQDAMPSGAAPATAPSAAATAKILHLGLLKSCYPRRGTSGEGGELQESTEETCACAETAEERLYFERLEAASRLAREEERRQEEEEAERERQEEAEQAAQSAMWRARREARERARREQEKVSAFLKANGFSGVAAKRKRLFAFSYPLHLAVEDNSAEMVQLLLQAGAERGQRNSLGQTPEALAQKRNHEGSHDEVLALLRPPAEAEGRGS